MRLSTITNYAYGATVALTLASGAVMLMASGAEEKERAAVEQRAVFDQMTAALVEDAYRLTEQARAYVITGDPSHIIAYRREKAALRSVEQRNTHPRDQGASHREPAALHHGPNLADALHPEQPPTTH